MRLFVESFDRSLNKFGEELCGDCTSVVRTPESVIAVVADGLGSGVKANILATLTTRIASSMLRQGATVDEVVETLVSTLPVCRVRQLAYSTFLIMQVFLEKSEAYLVEFDCPDVLFWRDGSILPLNKQERMVKGRAIKEARFAVRPGDTFVLISDGVIHAGVGGVLNLGWQWENVAQYLEKIMSKENELPKIVALLSDVCQNLYMYKPGDDATVLGLRVREAEPVILLAGPPEDVSKDTEVVDQLLHAEGRKVVCGGTTAQIVSRVSGRPLLTSLDFAMASVPPTAQIPGLDLVTEGVLTLTKALELIRRARAENTSWRDMAELNRSDGASRLARLLLCHCTHLQVLLGRAINPAHQNPDLPRNLAIKLKVVEELCSELQACGKEVELKYY